jgi:L-threonylcarbamoyladenylate synthase
MASTKIVKLDGMASTATLLVKAAQIIRAGGLVAFPTETVYGLGANALDAGAVERIFLAKGRPANNPVIVHAAELAAAKEIVSVWPERAERLAQLFWPGPLTLVLPRSPIVPDVVTAGGSTVAVRMPQHPVALALIRASGVPIAAPSANTSGAISPTTAEHVLQALAGKVDLILDGGPTIFGLESTVLDLSRTPPRLLRPGHITPAQIEAVIGPIERPTHLETGTAAPLPSPGLLSKHYAPRTETHCVEIPALSLVRNWSSKNLRVGWLAFGEPDEKSLSAIVSAMPGEKNAYAAIMYAVLHRLDHLGLDRIVIELPPDTEEWLAVRDRLIRAGSH